MYKLSINLLGGFSAQLNGAPVIGFVSSKVRALLIYLVLEATQIHDRSSIAGLLWPEWNDTQARTYLRHAIANLRQLLRDREATEPFLLVSRHTIQFNSAALHQIDVLDLLSLLSGGIARTDLPNTTQLESVLWHYSPLLPNFTLSGCAEFETWLEARREQLQRKVFAAIEQLAALYQQQGTYRKAIQHLQHLVELEPWREETHRQLMLLFALNGQRSVAVMQYKQCERLLQEELDLAPSAETLSLYRKIVAYEIRSTTHSRNVMETQDSLSELHGEHSSQDGESSSLPWANTVPAPMTSLVGRQEVCAKLVKLIDQGVRLMTLTGPAGVGKTRLAIALSTALERTFPDGIYFVALAPLQEASMLIATVARQLHVRETKDQPLLERVQSAIGEQQMLLILDNFEHLMTAASLVPSLLTACPCLKIIVTSREVLQLYGEYEFAVPPLPTPARAQQGSSLPIQSYAAIDLFLQRAQAVRADFPVDSDTLTMIAEICERLDGLPLAIELAAAEVKFHSLSALHRQLVVDNAPDAIHSLKGYARDLPERHQTLQHAIAWSYDLLTNDEQDLLRRVSASVAGFTFEVVIALYTNTTVINHLVEELLAIVWPDPQLVDPTIVPLHCPILNPGNLKQSMIRGQLTALVNKSLVQYAVTPSGHENRYTVLEMIRAFGLMLLEAESELYDVKYRWLCYYLALVVDAETQINGAESDLWLIRLTSEYHNLRAALAWAVTNDLIEIAMRFACALFHYWVRKGYEREAAEQFRQLLPLTDEVPWTPLYARFLFCTALVHDYYTGDRVASKPIYEKALTVSRAVKDELKAAHVLNRLSGFAYTRGDYQRWSTYLAETQQSRRKYGDLFGYALVGGHTGKEYAQLGRISEGRSACQEALAIFREIGDKWGTILTLWNYGQVALLDQCLDEAEALLTECLAFSKELNDQYLVAQAQLVLGRVAIAQSEFTVAEQMLVAALRTMFEMSNRDGMVSGLEAWAMLAEKQREPLLALRLAALLTHERRNEGFVLPPLLQDRFDQMVADAHGQLTTEQAHEAWQSDRGWNLEDAVKTCIDGPSVQSLKPYDS